MTDVGTRIRLRGPLTAEQRQHIRQERSRINQQRIEQFDNEDRALTRDCAHCGQPFEATNYRQRYCRPAHRKYRWQTDTGRERNRETKRRLYHERKAA